MCALQIWALSVSDLQTLPRLENIVVKQLHKMSRIGSLPGGSCWQHAIEGSSLGVGSVPAGSGTAVVSTGRLMCVLATRASSVCIPLDLLTGNTVMTYSWTRMPGNSVDGTNVRLHRSVKIAAPLGHS